MVFHSINKQFEIDLHGAWDAIICYKQLRRLSPITLHIIHQSLRYTRRRVTLSQNTLMMSKHRHSLCPSSGFRKFRTPVREAQRDQMKRDETWRRITGYKMERVCALRSLYFTSPRLCNDEISILISLRFRLRNLRDI